MTVAMLALAGFPATVGFFGKVYLIEAAVDNGYGWLGVVIVSGRPCRWPTTCASSRRSGPAGAESRALTPGGQPVMAGGARPACATRSPLGRRRRLPGRASSSSAIFPQPLFDVAQDAGAALGSLV